MPSKLIDLKMRTIRIVSVLAVYVSLLATALWAQSLPQNANELVRAAVKNELKQETDGILFAFKQRTEKPKGTTLKQMVETPEGVIGRTLLVNGKPLTPEQVRDEDARVNRLLDSRQWRDKVKEQKEDEERTRKMLAAIPDAFIFTYANGAKAGTGVALNFTPNPDFDPPSKETLVFQGMTGTVVIDSNAMRLAKIDGTMMRDVTIGWGILGRLNKGGHFYVEQAPVLGNHWETVKMTLDFTGKALIFKNIRIKQTETLSDFRRVDSMNVAQAIKFLKMTESAIAQNAPN